LSERNRKEKKGSLKKNKRGGKRRGRDFVGTLEARVNLKGFAITNEVPRVAERRKGRSTGGEKEEKIVGGKQ